jgi:CspA family cold shock protein
MESGTVKWFSLQKGHGFIKPDNGKHNVFVGVHVVHKAGLSDLKGGQRVIFEIDQDKWMDWACARSLALLAPAFPSEDEGEEHGTISAVPARDHIQVPRHLGLGSFSPPISMRLWSALSVLLPRLIA